MKSMLEQCRLENRERSKVRSRDAASGFACVLGKGLRRDSNSRTTRGATKFRRESLPTMPTDVRSRKPVSQELITLWVVVY